MNAKSNCHPSYMRKASEENDNVAKNSACKKSELIHCPVPLTRDSQHRSDCSSVSKLGKGSTLNRKGYHTAPKKTPYTKNPKTNNYPSQNPTKHTKQTPPHHL